MTVFTSGRKNGQTRARGYIENWRPHAKTRELIEQAQAILGEYEEHRPLTVRQIFYRLVGAYGYAKTEQSYKKLCGHLVNARRARVIAFGDIRDDGTTNLWTPWHDGIEDFWDEVAENARAFRLNRQAGQRVRIELWCEAAGMVPQLHHVAGAYSVTVYSNGGFASLPAVRQIVRRCCGHPGPTVLLHVGDLDPSGESVFEAMTEDVAAFLEDDRVLATQRLVPERVALTAEQVAAYSLPTTPPKLTDSRSGNWEGETCQAEALAPDVLAALVREAIEAHLDLGRVGEQVERERRARTDLLRSLPAGSSS